jgi:amidohydrolase
VVVSIGQFSAGTTFNVIPDRAELKGTVRSFDEQLHRRIYRRILEMATEMARALGCTASMETVAIVPAVSNALEPATIVRDAAARILGAENIVQHRTMASEDMSFILDEIPGCYFFVGSSNEENGLNYPHHHPKFDFDERAMISGVAIMSETVAHYLVNSAVH